MSDLKARREARMQKIMENSASRLKKITSVTECDDTTTDHLSIHTNGLSSTNSTLPHCLTETKTFPINEVTNSTLPNNLTETSFPTNVADIPSTFDELLPVQARSNNVRELVLILLGLLTRLVYLISQQFVTFEALQQYSLNNIFVPYFLFEVSEYTFFKPFLPPFPYEGLLGMLNLGISREYIEKLLIVVKIFTRMVQDLTIYLFTFVCFDQVLDCFLIRQEIRV
ncbi:hypothetical protein PPYR_12697 [Photinus pyralis]|uniref:Uncharacterized protein n=1 Tax=Photinus pyralis TaxID=7054 RepID=A0A1Y1KEM1_PHOPY|nr:uncharacterized protein LOC116177874 [Photinus pyralis]KAB0793077.1 hypothetical protein PPYR_12697 [Photinus pyralis]